jgi:signal transduction histidine kinase/ActR/RegA family two-component response regulator
MFCIDVDLAELRRAQAELVASEERFRHLFQFCPVPLWLQDSSELARMVRELQDAGVEDVEAHLRAHPELRDEAVRRVRVVDVNDAALAQYRAERKEQLMENLGAVFPPDCEGFEQVLGTIAKGGDSFRMDRRHRTLNGRELEVDLFWQAVDGAGADYSRVLVAAVDVTESRQLMRELDEARAAAEAASRAKSDFLASMSHEIRTPMSGLMGMLQLARLDDLPPEADGYMEHAMDAGRALQDLLDDILDLSKVEAGRMELATGVFSLHALLTQVRDIFDRPATDKGLELALDLGPELPEWVAGDRGRLRQVIFNLVGNAVKFTREGQVAIAAHALDQAPDGQGRRTVEIAVSDTGIGMTPEFLERIFDAYAQERGGQGDNAPRGTGLGMAIVKRLSELMDGEVVIESEPGQGTTVRVRLPMPEAEPPEEAGKEERIAPQAAPQGMRVLVVEDDAINRLFMGRVLEGTGQEVDEAEDGAVALEKLRDGDFDIVLMDVQLPGMSGMDVTRRIRDGEAGEAARDVCIVAVTAHAMKGDRERFLEAGMDHYLAKPIDSGELKRVMAEAMRHKAK